MDSLTYEVPAMWGDATATASEVMSVNSAGVTIIIVLLGLLVGMTFVLVFLEVLNHIQSPERKKRKMEKVLRDYEEFK